LQEQHDQWAIEGSHQSLSNRGELQQPPPSTLTNIAQFHSILKMKFGDGAGLKYIHILIPLLPSTSLFTAHMPMLMRPPVLLS